MTEALVADGWTVMAPLLPGHGRMPKIEKNGSNAYVVTDYHKEFPDRKEPYMKFSDEMIKIAEEYKAENPNKQMVLGGCSHGGAIVGYMAMNGVRGTWDRILLMNPFFAPPSGLGADWGLSLLRDLLPALLPAFETVLGSDIVSFGADCQQKRWPSDYRDGGTGGICQFTLKNFRGVLEFGNEVEGEARARAAKDGVFTGGLIDRGVGFGSWVTTGLWRFLSGKTKPPPTNLKVQLLTTSKDNSISNDRIHFAAAAIDKNVKSGNSGYCVLDAEMSHTYIAPIDKPKTMDHWWLEPPRVRGGKDVITMLVDFVSKGMMVPLSGDTVTDDRALIGDPRCDVVRR